MRVHPRPGLAVVLAVLSTASLPATAQVPQADSLFPLGLARGTTAPITFTGSALDKAQTVWSPLPDLGGTRAADPKAVRWLVSAPRQLDEAACEVFLSAPAGLSNPQRLLVGSAAEAVEDESRQRNDTLDTAAPLTCPGAVSGRIDPATDVDFFRFDVVAGADLWIECRSHTLARMVEPALTVFDPDGLEIAHDDGSQREPLICLRPQKSGSFAVRVHERAYRKPAHNSYRLVVSQQPRIVAAFPDVLPPGTPTEVTLYGFNLPGGQPLDPNGGSMQSCSATVIPPKHPPDGPVRWRPAAGAWCDEFVYRQPGIAGQVWFGTSDGSLTIESEPANNDPSSAPLVTLPTLLVGQFLHQHDRDWIRFEARRGQTVWVGAYAERLGRAMDVDIAIHDSQGKLLFSLADTAAVRGRTDPLAAATVDPIGSWQVPADGQYRLIVHDLYGPSLGGPGRTYRIRLATEPLAGCVVALLGTQAKPQSINLAPGGKATISLLAHDFSARSQAITVRAVDLPAGISAADVTIDPKTTTTTLTLSAAKDAPPWIGPLRLQAELDLRPSPAPLPLRAAVADRPGGPMRLCEIIPLAVTTR